jgi:dGTPase
VRVHEVVRGLINWLVSGLIEGTLAASSGLSCLDQVRAHPSRVAQFTPETAAGSAELKRYRRGRVYNAEALVRARQDSTRRFAALFDFFIEHPERLPATHREELSSEPLHRLVCDYIAGMTDGYFLKICSQMGIQ